MPRIPRADSDARFQVADMPHLVGDGWTAPGRATQQLGQAIGQVGKAFAGLGTEQDQQAEKEEMHEARLAALNLKNEWDLDEINTQGAYNGDGKDYASERTALWASKVGEYQSRFANAKPNVRRFSETFAATATGQVAETAARFGRSRYEGHLVSQTEAAVTGQLAQMATPEAAERYKAEPQAFESDLRLKIQEAGRIIDALPIKDQRADALRKGAVQQIEKIIEAAPGGVTVPTIQKMIEEFSAPNSVPTVPPGSNAVPGPQSGLPDGKLSIEPAPLQRTVGRPRSAKVAGVVMHQTWGSDTIEGNGSWSNKTNTGANYYIAKDGKVYQWAPDEIAMGHVGKGRDSSNNKRPDFTNDNTIGIEIMTRPNERPNAQQVAAARALTMQLASKYGFSPEKDVFGHGELTSPGHRRGDEAIEAVNAIRSGGQVAQTQSVPRETSGGVSRISPDGVQLVKQLEGKKLKAYEDGRQISIGYGTRATSKDEVIDDAEAERRLTAELAKADQFVDKFVSVPLNQNQRDALTSYVYNAGPNGKAAREVFAAINAGNMAKAAEIMKADDKGGVVAGRRDKEIALFLKPDVRSRAFTQVAGLGNFVPSSTGQQATQPPADDGPARVFFDADRNYTKTEIDNLIKKHGPNIVIGGNPLNEGYKEMAAYAREKGAKVHAYKKGPGEPEFGYQGDGKVKFPQDHEEIKAKGFSVSDWQKGGKWLAAEREDMLAAKKEGAEPYSVEWDNINDKKPGEIRDLLADQTKWAKENGVTTRVVLKNLNARQWQAVNQGIEQGRIDKNLIAPFAIVEEHMADGDRQAAEAEAKRQGIAQFRTENTMRYASPADGFERPSNRIPGSANDNGRLPVHQAQLRPSVESHLVEALQKKLPALKQKRAGELQSAIKGIEEAAVEGKLPNERSLAQITQQVVDVGDKGLAARFQNAVITARMNKEYIQAPVSLMARDLSVMDAMIAQSGVTIVPKGKGTPSAEGGGDSETEGLPPALALTVQRRDALKKLHDKAVEELKKDPVAWAVKAEVVSPLPPLTKETFSVELLREKAAQTDAIANHYGEEFRQYFSPGEKEHLKALFGQGGKPMIAMAGMMVEAYGPKAVKAIGEIAKDAPEAAHLGWLIVNKADNQTVKDLAAAVELKRFREQQKGKEVEAITAQQVSDKFHDGFKASLGFVEDKVREQVLHNAKVLYEYRVNRTGQKVTKDNVQDGVLTQVFKELLGENKVGDKTYGGIATGHGGFWSTQSKVPVHLPVNVKQDAFFEMMRSLRNSDFGWTIQKPDGTGGGMPEPKPDRPRVRGTENLAKLAEGVPQPEAVPPTAAVKERSEVASNVPADMREGAEAAMRAAGALPQMAMTQIDRSGAVRGAPLDYKGRPMNWSAIASRGTFITVGEGKYKVAMGDPFSNDQQIVGSTAGGHFVIDLNDPHLQRILRERNPNAFRPY